MPTDEQDKMGLFKIVINPEEQYSIWPVDRENPTGWTDVGKKGTKAECLAYISEVWTDMRPASLRRRTLPIKIQSGFETKDAKDVERQ